MRKTEPIGEIVAAQTTRFVAETPEVGIAPDFGAVVCADAGEETAFGIVYNVISEAREGREVTPFWLPYDRLREQQPQLLSQLRTRFEALIVAHGDTTGRIITAELGRKSLTVHRFVYRAAEEQIATLLTFDELWPTLLFADIPQRDALVAAVLRQGAGLVDRPQRYLIQTGKTLLHLLRNDFDRYRQIEGRLAAIARALDTSIDLPRL